MTAERNGFILKIIIGVLTGGLITAGAGVIKLHSDVQILKADTQLGRRVEIIEILIKDVATDRDKRTIILQQLRDSLSEEKMEIIELRHRLDIVERRAR